LLADQEGLEIGFLSRGAAKVQSNTLKWSFCPKTTAIILCRGMAPLRRECFLSEVEGLTGCGDGESDA
jgi:hypothetical protein